MNAVDLIIKKRDGHRLSKEEIDFLIAAYTKDEIPDYLMAALAMAIYFKGMDPDETLALVQAMTDSGEVMDFSDVEGIKVDKHSTGGVGDKVTLILVPLLMALDYKVPKMSGRGLGHTGGTVDKLEGIPGFRCELSMATFKKQVQKIGGAIIGQTANLAPADKKLYALRDVTGTVESIPLIAGSIMSKKLAGGSDAIILDVKVGKGAFVKDIERGLLLGRTMVDIGRLAGRKTMVVLSDMDQPLGLAVGNNLEVLEALQVLAGKGPKDVYELTVTLATIIHQCCGNISESAARAAVEGALASGAALEKFQALVTAQGGDIESNLPLASCYEFLSPGDRYVWAIDALAIGKIVSALGAGRAEKTQKIDHGVGLVLQKKVGDRVKVGDVLAKVYARTAADYEKILPGLNLAFAYCRPKPEAPTLIHDKILPEEA